MAYSFEELFRQFLLSWLISIFYIEAWAHISSVSPLDCDNPDIEARSGMALDSRLALLTKVKGKFTYLRRALIAGIIELKLTLRSTFYRELDEKKKSLISKSALF